MRYFKKQALVGGFGADFLAGADPTGYASQVRAKNVTKNVGAHRIMNDVGGFALGAGISGALTAGALALGSKITKGPISKTLMAGAKDTFALFNPKKAIKSVKGFVESYPVLSEQTTLFKELPNLKNMTHGDIEKLKVTGPELYQKVITNQDRMSKLKLKYNEDPMTLSRRGAAITGTLATVGLGGVLNATTSDIQFQAGRKFKEYEEKLKKK